MIENARFIEIPTKERLCDCCQSNYLIDLWKYKYKTRTISKSWLFNVNNVICENCGFVFTSPVLSQAFFK